jgi:hypothetical protein
MDKLKKTKTVYIGIELLAGTKDKATTKTLDMLKYLYDEGFVENYEVFVADDHSLKESKRLVTDILFEVMKVKDLSDKVYKEVAPMISYFLKVIGKK